jgi:hypothetical protein
MTIKGAEGMSPDDIRHEIERGGRLVIYTYCISLLIVTFKRPTDIQLIRAGHNPAAASWPWVIVSLLLGWWGFPWGPIYTIETLYRNLSGGIDVTQDVLSQIAPRAATPPPSAAPAPTLHVPQAPAPGFNWRVAGFIAGGICALVFLVLCGICWHKQTNLEVVLVSGLDQPTTVTVNGERYPLGAHGTRTLTLPEGEITVEDAAGRTQTVTFSRPFFDHLGDDKVGIINVDRAALVLKSDVPYYKEGTTPSAAYEEPAYTIYANEVSYFLAKPDFLFREPDTQVSMPSGTTRVVRTRLENLRVEDLGYTLGLMLDKNGYPAIRDHLSHLARVRTDEELLGTAVNLLKPEDLPSFFRIRLADRPVLVEWHRYYQQAMDVRFPEHDLVKEYRGYLQAEPADGALMYLLGRQTPDEAEASDLWRQAAGATPPCAYAFGAMAYDAMSDGRFTDALEFNTAATQAGLSNRTRKAAVRQALWALGRADELFALYEEERKAAPLDLAIAIEEINADYVFRRDPAAAQKVRESCLASYEAARAPDEHLAITGAYLKAAEAYSAGDMAGYAAAVARIDSPILKFNAACSRRDLAAATEAIKGIERPTSQSWFLLSLVAAGAHDATAEAASFQKGIEAMQGETTKHRHLATLMNAPQPDARAICAVRIGYEEKRVLLAVMGVRDPTNRATYFELARKLNFDPDFPCKLLTPVLAPPI